ncbi:type II secretion system F family protein [Aquihabitans daechungensis]|uniref:type II secretion system F family protein n=1 Tax=Aquihabitans daechungensis TaxID=1052257 RepID=UPI003B9E3283
MTAAIVACTALLGWSLRLARTGARRPARRPDQVGAVGVGQAVRHSLRSRIGASGRARTVDPAPLLQFRTAVERGASVLQAFESVAVGSGPWADGARRVVRRVRAGSGVQDAVDTWVIEGRDPAVRLLADALAISSGTGGSHVRAVDAVIDAVRERAALQREVRALASQAQTSAVVLVLLPVGFAAAVAVIDPRVRSFYVGSVLGPVCVVVGVVLDALGGWLMARLVRSVA